MDYNVGCVGEFEALQSEDVEVILRNTVERCAQDKCYVSAGTAGPLSAVLRRSVAVHCRLTSGMVMLSMVAHSLWMVQQLVASMSLGSAQVMTIVQ
jgi:hypothetical protein